MVEVSSAHKVRSQHKNELIVCADLYPAEVIKRTQNTTFFKLERRYISLVLFPRVRKSFLCCPLPEKFAD